MYINITIYYIEFTLEFLLFSGYSGFLINKNFFSSYKCDKFKFGNYICSYLSINCIFIAQQLRWNI